MNSNYLKGALLVFIGLMILFPPFGSIVFEYAWVAIGFYCLYRGTCLLVGKSRCGGGSCHFQDDQDDESSQR